MTFYISNYTYTSILEETTVTMVKIQCLRWNKDSV